MKETEGQIAHLDRDRTNAIAENLAFLCLECHKKYDTKSNRVLGFTAAEIRLYREKLCRALKVDQTEWTITISVDNSKSEKIRSLIQKAHSDLLKECPDAKLSEGPMG
ncbi:MAG TPA: hypothetical protein PK671_26745 [Candidatus Obscuribacter sp.]|nr:hypothetical protein [Candidatus Obscuribacter sp.]